LLESLHESAHDGPIELVLEDRVFHAGIDGGVVVYFHDHDPPVHLLEIHAIEPIADEAGRLGGEDQHVSRGLIQRQGTHLAVPAIRSL